LLLLLFEKEAFDEVVFKAKFITPAAVGPDPEANATLVVASVPLAVGFAAGFAKTWVVFDKPATADKSGS
jgi:hypothetical protein